MRAAACCALASPPAALAAASDTATGAGATDWLGYLSVAVVFAVGGFAALRGLRRPGPGRLGCCSKGCATGPTTACGDAPPGPVAPIGGDRPTP